MRHALHVLREEEAFLEALFVQAEGELKGLAGPLVWTLMFKIGDELREVREAITFLEETGRFDPPDVFTGDLFEGMLQ